MKKLKDEVTSASTSPVKGGHQSKNEQEITHKKKKRGYEEFQNNGGHNNNDDIVFETPQSSLNTGIINFVEKEPQQKKKKKKKKVLDESINDSGDIHFVGTSKNNNNNQIPSTSQKKLESNKIEHHDNSDDEEIDLEDRNERGGSITSNTTPTLVMPKDMYCFCKFLMDLNEQNILHLSSKKGNAKFNTLLRDVPNVDPSYDLGHLQSSFVNFYRWSTLPSEIPLIDAIKKVMDFVQSEQILHRFPDFPKLKTLWAIYLNKCGVGQELFSKNINNLKLRENFKDKNNKKLIEAEEEFNKRKNDLIISCKEFLDKYKDNLFEPQITSIQKKLNKLEREVTENQGGKFESSKKQKKPRPTAFDLFKKTKEGKYIELEESERERKLLRQFEKLDPVQRNIYESIAERL